LLTVIRETLAKSKVDPQPAVASNPQPAA
jgi:hypothetical protein